MRIVDRGEGRHGYFLLLCEGSGGNVEPPYVAIGVGDGQVEAGGIFTGIVGIADLTSGVEGEIVGIEIFVLN